MLKQRHHPRLEGVPDVLGLDDGIGFGVALLLDVYSTAREPLPPQGRVVAQPMQFLRRIAQPSPGVSYLRVLREHQAVGDIAARERRSPQDGLTGGRAEAHERTQKPPQARSKSLKTRTTRSTPRIHGKC